MDRRIYSNLFCALNHVAHSPHHKQHTIDNMYSSPSKFDWLCCNLVVNDWKQTGIYEKYIIIFIFFVLYYWMSCMSKSCISFTKLVTTFIHFIYFFIYFFDVSDRIAK